MQIKSARWLSNSLRQRTTVTKDLTSGDVLVRAETRIMGSWRAIQEYSANHGDAWLEKRQVADSSSRLEWREVLCLRSRIQRGDAVYLQLEELRFVSQAQLKPVSAFQRPVGFGTDPRHALRAALSQQASNGQSSSGSSSCTINPLAQSIDEQEVEVHRRIMVNGCLISDTHRQYALCPRDDSSSSDEELGGRTPEPESALQEGAAGDSGNGEQVVVLRSGWLDVKGKLGGWSKNWFDLQVPASVLAYAQQLRGRRSSGELAPEVVAKLASPAVQRLLAQQRASKAVLGWQQDVGSESNQGRQAVPLREVERVTCTVHQRLLRLVYFSNRTPLLLRALTEADCATWARCLEDEAGMKVERVDPSTAPAASASQTTATPVIAHAIPTTRAGSGGGI